MDDNNSDLILHFNESLFKTDVIKKMKICNPLKKDITMGIFSGSIHAQFFSYCENRGIIAFNLSKAFETLEISKLDSELLDNFKSVIENINLLFNQLIIEKI